MSAFIKIVNQHYKLKWLFRQNGLTPYLPKSDWSEGMKEWMNEPMKVLDEVWRLWGLKLESYCILTAHRLLSGQPWLHGPHIQYKTKLLTITGSESESLNIVLCWNPDLTNNGCYNNWLAHRGRFFFSSDADITSAVVFIHKSWTIIFTILPCYTTQISTRVVIRCECIAKKVIRSQITQFLTLVRFPMFLWALQIWANIYCSQKLKAAADFPALRLEHWKWLEFQVPTSEV